MKKIQDIHSHILYGIDDGASNLNMSIELIGKAYEQGVRGIFLTNHSDYMKKGYKKYHAHFEELKKLVEEKYPGLSLFKGCEIFCSKTEIRRIVRRIKSGVYPTMNGTKYVLVEFDPEKTNGMEEMKYCLECLIDKGYIPVIAHVERYKKIYDDPLKDLTALKILRCLTQINLFSVE